MKPDWLSSSSLAHWWTKQLYTALKEAAVGAGGALRAAGWNLPMRNRLAMGLAGGYWGVAA